MTKSKSFHFPQPENLPEWYWVSGLHDACIVEVESYDFPSDYKKYAGKKSEKNRNSFLLKIDASGALFDSEVKEIEFFNYKILTKDVDLKGREKIWWHEDRLFETEGGYVLEVDLGDCDGFPEEFTWKIFFERAQVIRKG